MGPATRTNAGNGFSRATDAFLSESMGWTTLPHIVLGMDFEEVDAMTAAKRVGFVR
jgi:hypothetical protein